MRERARTRCSHAARSIDDRRSGLGDGDLRRLFGEVGRGVFFFGTDLGFGFDAKIVVDGVAVAGVGGEPQGAGERLAIVGEGQLEAVDGRAAMVAVGVVEVRRAEADLHVGDADMIFRAADESAVLGANQDGVGIADGVTEEVGRKLACRRVGSIGDGRGRVEHGAFAQ